MKNEQPKNPEINLSDRVKPVLRWPGGKSRMLKQLLPMIPAHVCYCEPFAGGLAVLLAKPRSKVEVINDLNGELVALYRNLQYHLPELLREIDYAFSSRKVFHDLRMDRGLTEIQKAARFLLRNRTSFNGDMSSFAVARSAGGGAAFNRVKNTDLLGEAHQRLDGVVVENLSYERCLELYDGPETFFFIDPPYLDAQTKAYEGWSADQLKEFRKRLRKVKGQWIVTLDDSPLNRELFQDCNLLPVTTRNGMVNSRTHGEATFGELIITPSGSAK